MNDNTKILLPISGIILLFAAGLLYLKMKSETYCCVISFVDTTTLDTVFTAKGTCRDDSITGLWYDYAMGGIESEE